MPDSNLGTSPGIRVAVADVAMAAEVAMAQVTLVVAVWGAADRAMAAEEAAEVRVADWAGCDTLECAVVAWAAAAVVAVEGVAARAAEFQAMVAVGLAVMAKGRL